MRMRTDRPAVTVAAAALALATGTMNAGAALSPYYQSVREIEAIVGDQRVSDALQYGEPILSIASTGNDIYEVRTSRCTLTVKIVDVPSDPEIMGPRKFDLQVGRADCQ